TRVEANVDEAARLRDAGVPPCREHGALAAESPGAETQHGNFEARSSEQTIFHSNLHELLPRPVKLRSTPRPKNPQHADTLFLNREESNGPARRPEPLRARGGAGLHHGRRARPRPFLVR